jgi:hypothetical protein
MLPIDWASLGFSELGTADKPTESHFENDLQNYLKPLAGKKSNKVRPEDDVGQ